MHLTEEHIFEEFGLELEPDSARAIVTRLQQAGLEMEPSQNAQGVHEMTLKLPAEELDQEGREEHVDEADQSGNRTHIDTATQTDASDPQREVQEEQEVIQAAAPVNASVPSSSGQKRRRKGVPRPHWRKMTWVLILWSAVIVILGDQRNGVK